MTFPQMSVMYVCVSPTTVNNAVLESGTFQLTCAQHPPRTSHHQQGEGKIDAQIQLSLPTKTSLLLQNAEPIIFSQNKQILQQIHQVV